MKRVFLTLAGTSLAVACAPSVATLMRVVFRVMRSRTKTSSAGWCHPSR